MNSYNSLELIVLKYTGRMLGGAKKSFKLKCSINYWYVWFHAPTPYGVARGPMERPRLEELQVCFAKCWVVQNSGLHQGRKLSWIYRSHEFRSWVSLLWVKIGLPGPVYTGNHRKPSRLTHAVPKQQDSNRLSCGMSMTAHWPSRTIRALCLAQWPW